MLLYVFLLLVVGVPLFFMELAAGQSIRQGSIGVWKHISPKLAGIGYSSCMVRIYISRISFFYTLDYLLLGANKSQNGEVIKSFNPSCILQDTSTVNTLLEKKG